MARGEHLEHAHVYRGAAAGAPASASAAAAATVPAHVDEGLLITMTVGRYAGDDAAAAAAAAGAGLWLARDDAPGAPLARARVADDARVAARALKEFTSTLGGVFASRQRPQ